MAKLGVVKRVKFNEIVIKLPIVRLDHARIPEIVLGILRVTLLVDGKDPRRWSLHLRKGGEKKELSDDVR